MEIALSEYTLDDVWTPIRASIKTEILNSYNGTTTDTITQDEADKIEKILYNYTYVLRQCYMSFSNDITLSELQTMLKNIIKQKTYALVVDWKALNSSLKLENGYNITQNSFYDVAETPHMEQKDFNNLDIRNQQLDLIYTRSNSFKDLYRELKTLIRTIYY